MDFDLAEQNYIRLEKLRRSGQISLEEYRVQLAAMQVVDEQGRTWMVQEQTGQWHVWDGARWVPQAPPGRPGIIAVGPVSAQPSGPVAPPPAAATPGYFPAQPQYGPPPGVSPQPAGPWAGPMPTAGVDYRQAGYATQPVVPQQVLLARKRPGCVSVTLRMLLWALVWGVAAWAVNAFLKPTPWWAYLAVGLAALATLILWVRMITRSGRELRRLAKGGGAA
ncbi:MAG: hypothetical protein ABFD20_10830 [Anaerolineales bacterium]